MQNNSFFNSESHSHPDDHRVLITSCYDDFYQAVSFGYHAALLIRPEEKVREEKELVKWITKDLEPEDVRQNSVQAGRDGRLQFDGKSSIWTPLKERFQEMADTLQNMTEHPAVRIITEKYRTFKPRDQNGGHTHNFDVLNVIYNGQQGTGWWAPDGSRLSAGAGEWMFIGKGFPHYPTTTPQEPDRVVIAATNGFF